MDFQQGTMYYHNFLLATYFFRKIPSYSCLIMLCEGRVERAVVIYQGSHNVKEA